MPALTKQHLQATADQITLTYLRARNFRPKMSFGSKGNKGQGLVEYALILVLVAIVVMLSLSLIAPWIKRILNSIGCTLDSPPGTDILEECFEHVTPTPET